MVLDSQNIMSCTRPLLDAGRYESCMGMRLGIWGEGEGEGGGECRASWRKQQWLNQLHGAVLHYFELHQEQGLQLLSC